VGEAAILSNRCAQIAYLFIDGLFVKAVAAMSGGPPVAPVRVVPFTGPREGRGPKRHRPKVSPMPKFVIEREVPNAGQLSGPELQSIAKRSVGVLRQLGPEIQWVESYVTGNHLHCVYVAPDEEMIREHGRLGGFPVTRVFQVAHVIDPTTAEV